MAAWTTADIARELGLANAAVARTWLRRAGLQALPERVGDAKVYDSDAVLAAKEQMPRSGRRAPASTVDKEAATS